MWQKQYISDAIYALVDKARAARNAFIHSADECSPEAAQSAVEATLNLIGAIANEDGVVFDIARLMSLLNQSTTHFRKPITDDKGVLLAKPLLWRYPDPAPGFEDWGERPFEKIPEIQLQPLKPKDKS